MYVLAFTLYWLICSLASFVFIYLEIQFVIILQVYLKSDDPAVYGLMTGHSGHFFLPLFLLNIEISEVSISISV